MSNYLIFGASGAIGSEIVAALQRDGNQVVRVLRQGHESDSISLASPDWAKDASLLGPFDGALWAQGINSSGTVLSTDVADLTSAFEANVVFIAQTLAALVDAGAFSQNARLVVLSSIWQEHSRDNKFAYSVSKSALAGFVRSVAIDLANFGISINAVLPGVIDTPMTKQNLTASQIESVESSSLGGKLTSIGEIYEAVNWLLSAKSSGLNGQFLTVDKGWSINRHV